MYVKEAKEKPCRRWISHMVRRFPLLEISDFAAELELDMCPTSDGQISNFKE